MSHNDVGRQENVQIWCTNLSRGMMRVLLARYAIPQVLSEFESIQAWRTWRAGARLTDQIYRSFNEDCLVVQEFFTKGLNSFYQRCVDNPTKQKGTKLNEYEMVDSCFLGSSNSMYKLANDFFKNVKSDFLFRCMQQDEESWCWPSTDKLWVNDILKKNIPCQTGELNKWLVIRNQTAFEKAKPFLSDYDNCLDFLDVYSHRLPVLDQNWIDRFIDLYFK